ncbi:MAG TPA: tRNA (adenosine(37)-N6)-threonylcarbamoyltransferase complex dimerization subunit type 1 TsaB [Candidatus Saccharimonadales bacterium]|nr:tRNA (adenosine(37)-N6)-threonylcarbamoyltransferase complex dimerization subunit type 1 TsaB [Candidatus Saccharimonadales bacterium]
MLILTIRSDKPEAEIGMYDGDRRLAYTVWAAHRELAETIQQKIDELLAGQGKTLKDLQGIVAYQGPGSFTGLRIGLTVANAFAYAQKIPIVATSGKTWIATGTAALLKGGDQHIVVPEYGSPPHITQPKK